MLKVNLPIDSSGRKEVFSYGLRTARRAAAAGTRPEDQYVQSRTGAETGAGTAGAGREIKFKNYLDRTKVLIYTQDCNRTKVHERVIGISVTQRAGLNLTVIQKMYDRASSGIPQTKQTETKAETCMQDVCRSRLLGRTGLFEGVPVFLTFCKNICS